MKLFIKPSEKMDAVAGEDAVLERRLIRTPKEFRDFAELALGEFLSIRTREGRPVSLAIEMAYSEDSEKDSMSAYVTSEIYELLLGKGVDGYDVELVDGITLGCDPELILVDRKTAKVVTAERYVKKWNSVGYDGLLLELRPFPSTDPGVVAYNLFQLIQKARVEIDKKKKFDPVMMTAVSSYQRVTAGFHLHYGIPKALLGWRKLYISDQIVKAMDYYVGIPSMMPEKDADFYRRTVPYMEYGKPGTYRIDNITLEYRVPGAALMKHPVLARGIMSLGAVVMEDIVSRIRHITNGFTDLTKISRDEDIRAIYPNIPPVMTIFSTICSPGVDQAQTMFKQIRSDVEKMVGFGRRAGYVNEYFNCIQSGVEFSPDVEENWWRFYNGQRQSGQMDVLRSSV